MAAVMMIVLGMLVVTALMAWVVPKITTMLEDTGKTLPLPTQILVNISDAFKDFWWVGLLGIALFSFVIERVHRSSEKGRLFLDRLMLRLPVAGDVLRKQAVSRFTKTLSTLLQSGVTGFCPVYYLLDRTCAAE